MLGASQLHASIVVRHVADVVLPPKENLSRSQGRETGAVAARGGGGDGEGGGGDGRGEGGGRDGRGEGVGGDGRSEGGGRDGRSEGGGGDGATRAAEGMGAARAAAGMGAARARTINLVNLTCMALSIDGVTCRTRVSRPSLLSR